MKEVAAFLTDAKSLNFNQISVKKVVATG